MLCDCFCPSNFKFVDFNSGSLKLLTEFTEQLYCIQKGQNCMRHLTV